MTRRILLPLALLPFLGCNNPPGDGNSGGKRWQASVGAQGTVAQTFDQLHWQHRSVADRDLFAVACVGNDIGWAAGQGGYVAHTRDGGLTWSVQRSHLTADLRAIRFATAAVGLVAGDGGALARTGDGGETWIPIDTHDGANLRGVALTAGVLLAVGDRGALLRSLDGGVTWARATLDAAGGADLNAVAADASGNLLVADSRGVLWQSANLGVSFSVAAVAPASLRALSIADDGDLALAAGDDGAALARVHNVWTPLQTGTRSRLRAALAGTPLYLAGDAGTLLTSVDNGAHWSTVDLGITADLYGLEDL